MSKNKKLTEEDFEDYFGEFEDFEDDEITKKLKKRVEEAETEEELKEIYFNEVNNIDPYKSPSEFYYSVESIEDKKEYKPDLIFLDEESIYKRNMKKRVKK